MATGSGEVKQRVKRDGGFFTIEKKADRLRRGSICEQCGIRVGCEVWAMVEIVNKSGQMIVPIKACKLYIPVLLFGSDTGLFEHGSVNTFRLGMAWATRVTPGQRVRLDSNGGKVFGYAMISDIFSGTLRDMADTHAAENHMLRLRSDVSDYSEEMFKILRYAYGKLYVAWDRPVTVLYLEPVRGA